MPPSNAPSPPSLDDIFSSLLARRQAQGILRQLPSAPAPGAATAATSSPPPARLVDFSSNDYLSLSRSPDVQSDYLARLQAQTAGAAAAAAARGPDATSSSSSASAFGLGSGGSRLLDGDSPLAAALERDLAVFHRASAALLFNSGFDANTGLLACAPRAGDVVVLDELVHASVHAGVRLSRAAGRAVRFAHNAVWERQEEGEEGEGGGRSSGGGRRKTLEGVLRATAKGEEGRMVREGQAHVFVAVEAVYSMDGDVAPLEDIVRCVEERLPLGNGHVVVDEAHSNGLFGDRGRGLVSQLRLEDRIWARVNTFGKALGCSGGMYRTIPVADITTRLTDFCVSEAVVLCSPVTRAYLINYARTFIYTTAMGSPALLSIQVAYDFVASGAADGPRRKLQALIRHLNARLARISTQNQQHNAGSSPPSPPSSSSSSSTTPTTTTHLIRTNTATSSPQSPIIPIFTTRARSLAAHCQQRGYMVRAIVAPTVPAGTDRVRICLHAGNSVQECDGLCEAIEEWVAGQTAPISRPSERPPHQLDDKGQDEQVVVVVVKHRL